MTYDEIVALALSYADREDEEVTSKIDSFIKIVEARVNRKLRVFEMSIRATLVLSETESYYGLPPDFGGLRDIEISNGPGTAKCTLHYMSPEQLNQNQSNQIAGVTSNRIFYTLIAGQLQISPMTTGTMEIIYFQKLIPLTASEPDNWLSNNNPDGYIFGILTEISAFVKDKEATALWDLRYRDTIQEISDEDSDNRWSGTALEIRVG